MEHPGSGDRSPKAGDKTKGGEAKPQRGSQLGGARADFVASLGRKVADAREVLRAVEDEPGSPRARDELRRKLHALGAGARLLRFDAMAQAIQDAETVLERAAKSGAVRPEDLTFLASVLDDLPALAWGEAAPREVPSDHPAGPAPQPFAALVVGGTSLAEALGDEVAGGGRTFECERTEDPQAAVDLARVLAPDLVIVDADLDAAPELVEALLDDPLTEPVPVLVVGDFGPDEAAGPASRFIALGVAKLLPKPITAETLRRSCEEVLDQREGRTMRLTLGEPTLEQLGNRLAEEVKRALVDSVDRPGRSIRVPLGEGTEVLGALWGAIARVQEVITTRTDGAIRFSGDAPEGAIALAPWLHHDMAGADRMARGRGAATDVRLDRRRVVVADDDPGVTWFIADLLRTAGCEVHEALDGDSALDLAFKVSPELVVSDILMPGMDGFALCRALKRDVALRDTPVILLSWKEDLLQRVRELGASAAAYLKKESDSRAILARVREVIRPRARIEQRLRGTDEVRGRLDGLSVRLLLELACALRPVCRVCVRDASFLYEVEIRDGAPRRATRTAPDGTFERGERVLARMLGTSAGRFIVAPSDEAIRPELSGSLAQQLQRPVALARGAVLATTGKGTIHVERIILDEVGLDDYLRATPEDARAAIEEIAGGASPRKMVLGGEIAPTLLEDVLVDLAAHGAIVGVRGANGVDLLSPLVEQAHALLDGRAPIRRSTVPPAPRSVPARTKSSPAYTPSDSIAADIAAIAQGKMASAAPPSVSHGDRKTPAYESFSLSEPPPPRLEVMDPDAAPSSLEDALIRELYERSPVGTEAERSDLPPIVEPSELRPRSSNPPAPAAPAYAESDERLLPSIPPDAVVPGASMADEAFPPMPRQDPAKHLAELSEQTELDAKVEPLRELSMPIRRELSMPLYAPQKRPAPKEAEPEALPKKKAAPKNVRIVDESEPQRTPLSSSVAAKNEDLRLPKKKGMGGWLFLGGLGVLAVVIGMGLRWSMPAKPASTAAKTEEKNGAAPPPATATEKPAADKPARAAASAAPADAPGVTYADIPAGVEVPQGQGLLIVSAAADATVKVQGTARGHGAVKVPLAPGNYEVRVGPAANEQKLVEIRAGRAATVDMTPAH